jgi:2,3-bisphosphoglycerate-dependent phosphoglycerate mutase
VTRVWLLRHAETANPNVFHGAESDVELSERGQRQARAMGAVLAVQRPAGLVASGMRRARQTAAPIAEACALSVQIEPDLHERRVGAMSGRPFHQTDGWWPETLRRWVNGETGYTPEGAESFDAIAARVVPVWRRLTAAFAGRSLIVVAHGVVCKVLILSLARGWSPRDWYRLGPIHNLGISELIGGNDRWQLVRVNEIPLAVREG